MDLRHLSLLASLPLVLTGVGCGDPPPTRIPLEGGWVGTYECAADSKRFTLTVADNDEGEVGGEAFLDYQLVLLGTPFLLTARADLAAAGIDDDGTVEATVDVLDNATSQLPDFALALSPNEDVDELDGTLTRLDGDGAPTGDPCDVHVARTDL